MRWPATPGTNPGYALKGAITTIRWGTDAIINWNNTSGALFAIVIRARQRPIKTVYKNVNADGMTTSRTTVIDGQVFDLTVRDDSTFDVPTIGYTVAIADFAGLINYYNLTGYGLYYSGTVVESEYEAGAKQAGERTISVENLQLIESQSGS